MSVSPIEEAIEDIRQGKMVILVDDEDRENEGDLTMARGKGYARSSSISWPSYGRGLICLALTPEMVEQLQSAADGPGQPVALRDGVHGLHRGPPGGHHRDFRR